MNEYPKFPMTCEGYLAARDYILTFPDGQDKIDHGFSTDGYSVTALANSLYERHGDKQ